MKKLMLPLVALLLVLVACTEEETDNQAEQKTVTPVEIGEVTQRNFVVEKILYGRTTPAEMTPVMIQAPGEVDTVEVKKGDIIEEDDVIATITPAGGRGTIDILAPADGEIHTLTLSEGQMASNTEPVATIVNLDTVTIQATVTADQLDLFEDTEKTTVVIDDKEYSAAIDYVSSVANETGLYPVELSVENKDHQVKPGMVAVIHIPQTVVEEALIIPTTALVEETDQTFVYVVQDEKAVKTPVTVIASQTNQTAIEAKLSEGDTVVTSGQLTLSDGNKVRIMKEER